MEFSTISILDYLEDILANVGLPEAWLEWDSNDVTQIKDKSVKCEANLTEKTESNPVKNCEMNRVGSNGSNQGGNEESNRVGNE